MKYLIVPFFLLFCFGSTGLAQKPVVNNRDKEMGEPSTSYLNLNNISTIFRNDGTADNNLINGSAAFKFPKTSGKTAIYFSGLVWGMLAPSQIKVGGSTYLSGLQGGRITNSGLPWEQLIAEDPNAPHVRIYRIRPDVYPGGPPVDLSVEAIDEGRTEQEIRDQYELDWTEWRAADGAPFKDVDQNGIYDPSIDIPGVDGASQTIWFVANDLNPQLTNELYGSDPVGIEYQSTIWEYKNAGFLSNVIFRKYQLINKSNVAFNDMYVAMWSDPDIGVYTDDFAGCDTTLNLGFSLNGYDYDAMYDDMAPPSAGFKLLKGPSLSGGETLPMTVFYYLSSGGDFSDPDLGDPSGAIQYYNYFQGRNGRNGMPFINPITGLQTHYVLSGDPLTEEGWVDGYVVPPGDRRMGLVSGPFQMAPSDTQEVVYAEIAAIGLNKIHSFKLLKYFSSLTQDTYDSGLYISTPPAPPSPTAAVNDTGWVINLNWGVDTSLVSQIENFNQDGYAFQGYNVYQLPYPEAIFEGAVKIATFDIVDGVTTIPGIVMDPETGLPTNGNQQNGTDSGIKREISRRYDNIENSYMRVGKKYYFAVTAYTYNSDPQAPSNNSESLLQVYEATFYEGLSGAEYGDSVYATHQSGSGDGQVAITVTDPTQLTGNDYEVFFTRINYIRNEFGEWVPVPPGRNNGDDPDTLTGSTIDIAAVYGPETGTLELHCALNLVSPDFDWADGIKMIFPQGVSIIQAHSFDAGNGFIVPIIMGNIVNMGYVNHEYTTNGPFTGGEEWSIVVQAQAPFSVDWIIFDDGYSGGPLDAEGTTDVTQVGYAIKRQDEWNLKNLNTQDTLLAHQTVIKGYDLYTGEYVGDPEAEGVQISVDVFYGAPKTIGSLRLNGEPLEIYDFSADYNMTDFTVFGFPDGTAATSLPLYGGAGGTTLVEILQQDYELRWTGVVGDTLINGNNVIITKSGGSYATLFGASNYSIADHPLNPNPGSTNPFLIRIPFEVWNVDNNEQINLLVWDRNTNGRQPTDPDFQVWNTEDRMYLWAVNNQYSYSVIDPTSQLVAENATWNWVFFKSMFTTGDVIYVKYNNPVLPGVDLFTFTTPEHVVSVKDETLISSYEVYENYPNPFNPTTKIRFDLPEKGLVKLEVYNILGQRITQLINGELSAGRHEVTFNGSYLASGVYFYLINVKDKFFSVKKMLLLK